MKRGFLYGLGSGLVLEVVWCLVHALPLAALYGELGEREGYLWARIMALVFTAVFAAMAYFIIRWAYSLPLHHSWFHAVLGWLAGFLPFVVIIAREGTALVA